MIGKYPFKHIRIYPQMSKKDTILWNRFIDKYPNKFDSVDFDIRVGPWSDFEPNIPNNILFDGIWNSLWRVDAIGYKNSEIHIIEVKPNAMASAIGQVLCYNTLYRLQFKNLSSVSLAIITDIIKPPLKTCADNFNITLYTV